MRQHLYPLRQARYVVGVELKELKKSRTTVQRDSTFGSANQNQNRLSSSPVEALTHEIKRVTDAVSLDTTQATPKKRETVSSSAALFTREV